MPFLKEYGDCTGPLDFPMKSDDAKDLEKKLDTGDYTYKTLNGHSESFSLGEKADISLITDGSVDSDKEIINPDGLIWDRFRKNPIVAFNHNYDIPPVGKSIWQKKTVDGWKAKTIYTSRPESHPKDSAWFPESVFHMVKEGSLPGKSIGGLAKRREATPEEIQKGATKVADEFIVYEYSAVVLQANQNAIVESVSKGLIDIPKEILEGSFPEVFKALQEAEESLSPVVEIKSFCTADEYLKRRESEINALFTKKLEETPQIVEDTLNRLMGKVS